MHDANHYKRCLEEQIQLLVAHQSSNPEPDYEFVRNHAHAIVQICDEAAMFHVGHVQDVEDENSPLT
jgi:hypothetical protein